MQKLMKSPRSEESSPQMAVIRVLENTKDWKEDAKRRDFTINAMSYDPERNQLLYDYFGGQEDLRAGIIRFDLVPRRKG